MTAIQAIHVRGWEERLQPKAHVVYRIEIQASVRSWHMWRRYSEFVDLHTELTKSAGAPPPAELPISVWQAHPLVRTRARITREQLRALEALFAKTWFPTSQQRAEAASATGMREYSVTVWFQNRRCVTVAFAHLSRHSVRSHR